MNFLETVRNKLVASQKLFEALDDRGADLDAIHTVEHHFVAPQKTILEKIGKEATFLGFGYGEIRELRPEDGSTSFSADALSHIPILSEDYDVFIPAAREAIIMVALAKAYGAEYDGWGTKMIKKAS